MPKIKHKSFKERINFNHIDQISNDYGYKNGVVEDHFHVQYMFSLQALHCAVMYFLLARMTE